MIIEGKTAVVIGGAQGIGRAYAEALLDKGANVVIGDILTDKGRMTVSELCEKFGSDKAIFVTCDNTKADDIKDIFKEALDRYGKVDISVHNAGIIHEFEWEKCVDVNLNGTIRTTNEAMKHMSLKHGGKGGVIINTASISALRPEDWGPVYSSTKYAVLGYTLSWGLPRNLSVTGVRVNCLCPSTVNTEFIKQCSAGRAHHSEDKQDMITDTGKVEPTLVAEGLIKLIEDDSASGKALRVTSKYGLDFAEFQEQPPQ